MGGMFVVILDYVADLADIDAALPDHVAWLDQHYGSGLFLASGRREPRTGGLIFAAGDRPEVEEALAGGPFASRGLARHTVLEFHPSRFGGALDSAAVQVALG